MLERQTASAPRAMTCERCGAAFTCSIGGEKPCWCAALPPLGTPLAQADCLCPACLKAESGAQATSRRR